MYDLNAFQRDCLYMISGMDSPSGIEVRQKINEYYNKDVATSSVYPVLDDLNTMGLIKKSRKTQRTNQYTITARGEREIEEREEWEKEVSPIVGETDDVPFP